MPISQETLLFFIRATSDAHEQLAAVEAALDFIQTMPLEKMTAQELLRIILHHTGGQLTPDIEDVRQVATMQQYYRIAERRNTRRRSGVPRLPRARDLKGRYEKGMQEAALQKLMEAPQSTPAPSAKGASPQPAGSETTPNQTGPAQAPTPPPHSLEELSPFDLARGERLAQEIAESRAKREAPSEPPQASSPQGAGPSAPTAPMATKFTRKGENGELIEVTIDEGPDLANVDPEGLFP